MSSVKNRKSKSKGRFGVAGVHDLGLEGDSALYDYRRREFTQQAPIIIRPLRTIKAWAAEAGRDLNQKLTAMMAANPNATFTEVGSHLRAEFAEVRKRMDFVRLGEQWAKAGAGPMVRHLASRIA